MSSRPCDRLGDGIAGRQRRLAMRSRSSGPKSGIGDVLGGHRADAGARMRAAGADRRSTTWRWLRRSMPVRAQRPAIEEGHDRGDHQIRECTAVTLDLDAPIQAARERGDDETGRARKHAFEPFAHLAIDRFAIAYVGQIDDDAADVIERRRPPPPSAALCCAWPCSVWAPGIARMQGRAGVQVLGYLAAYEHHGAPRHHRLAQIVVELLLGIGVLGVEGPNASGGSCRHHYSAAIFWRAPDPVGEARRPSAQIRAAPSRRRSR